VTAIAPLKIGIDARAAAEVRAGGGRVVRELLRALAARDGDSHRFLLYARQEWDEGPLDERFQLRTITAPDPWWHILAGRAATRECDVFLSTNSYLTVRFLRIPSVPIVYDLLAFDPAMHPNRRSALIERVTLGPAMRRSTAVIAISQATAEALAARHPRTANLTTVALPGVAPTLSGELDPAEATKLPSGCFVLAVGTLEPRKNLPRLVDAYRALPVELQETHPLVVVGALGWDTGKTLEALRSLGERCRMLGYVSDAALAELYRRCAVFCFPSLGEGFGLPVLEAMAAGAAVLTSNCSSLPEVGGNAVAYADPARVDEIANQLESLLRDDARRSRLGEEARVRARQFSWGDFAESVLDVLERAAGRG
jgi:glycosyltransferase involved in cell wall biosynthesis